MNRLTDKSIVVDDDVIVTIVNRDLIILLGCAENAIAQDEQERRDAARSSDTKPLLGSGGRVL